MGYICKVCHEWVQSDPHKCSGKAIPSMSNMWGLPYVAQHELNAYTFPDLTAVLDQLDSYINSLKHNKEGKGGSWPQLSRTLKLTREITDPGMVLILGNPKRVGHECICEIMNDRLPGASYKSTHSQYRGPATFSFTNISTASEFFQKTGAINIMPDNPAYAGDKPATQLPEGRIIVNAHSRCAAGLLVHEIIHAYGGPAGMFGEGLTDWFTLDLMKEWGREYDGNPAYGYNVSLVDRVVQRAGKERVARMAFSSGDAWASAKAKMPKKMPSGKTIEVNVNYSSVLAQQQTVTELALKAQTSTMVALGFGDQLATMVPKPASKESEEAAGLPGALDRLGDILIALMPG